MRHWMARTHRLVPLALAFAATTLSAQRVTAPREHFGFDIGDDYKLATYTQLTGYWQKLARESNRMKLDTIGQSAEGRPHLMAIISSPANMQKLARYKEIAQKLARAEGLSEDDARALAREGKSVVWIDGGLHATEVLGAHQLIQTVYELVSKTDPETMRILDDCIILAVHANPDGMELVSSWYMQEADTLKRTFGTIPRLYMKWAGHDDNRDFYMGNLQETTNELRIQYQEWFPQIVYNHHQTGPAGAVMFAPPFRDPFNYNFDPLVPMQIDMVGAAMHSRFEVEGKPGVTMRSGAPYSTWWNGGLRTGVYFHNMIGLLTETIGSPTPQTIPFVPGQLLPRADMPNPITPQPWKFRQSIDYSITANRAVLDYASRYREQLLYNIYRMGRNSIERGNKDSWTISGKDIDAVMAAVAKDSAARARAALAGGRRGGAIDPTMIPIDRRFYAEIIRDPAKRDARGYIIPSDQSDFLTATKFINALQKNGITIHRATQAFQVAGTRYPQGSYVVKTAQAFRPHILDMFEPQDHPNDFAYPGGPPKPPYDNAGYTLAYQMGVKFDRVLDGFECPCEALTGITAPPSATVADAKGAAGYVFSHSTNDAFKAVNRLLKSQEDVYWVKSPTSVNGKNYEGGAFWVAAKGSTAAAVKNIAQSVGVSFEPTSAKPAVEMTKLKLPRVAVWDRYGGSMPSGWTQYELAQFDFPYDVVYPQQLDAGNLAAKYDVIIFPDGGIPAVASGNRTEFGGLGGFEAPTMDPSRIPEQYRSWIGNVTPSKTIPALKRFLDDGGKVVGIGSSTALAYHLNLPVSNQLTERTPNGAERELAREKLYIPGSILSVAVDNSQPITAGLPKRLDVFFDNSPVFRLQPDALARGVRPLAWFDSAAPLRSGWAWGQNYLEGGVAAVEADVGRGKVYLFTPEILFRGQPHGTFKFLFNSIYAPTSSVQTGKVM